MTRLTFRFSSTEYPFHQLYPLLDILRNPSSVSIGRLVRPAHMGLGPHLIVPVPNTTTMPMSTKVPPRRDLVKELEEGIKPWTGPSIFTTPVPRGRVSSPIDITSSPETEERTAPRVRGVIRYNSALPRTAYTPPAKVHPFFTHQRARTAPPSSVPASQKPRLVAHYSSTEASTSTSQSQQQSQDTQSTFGSLKGKEREVEVEGAPPGWAEDAIDEIADEFAKTRITNRPPLKNRSTVIAPGPAPGLPRPAATRLAPSSKSNPSPSTKPILPFFHHADLPDRPRIAYTTSPYEADDLLSCLRGDVFGFDLEWPPAGKYTSTDPKTGEASSHWVGRKWDQESRRYVFTPGRTALVQVCDGHLIVLIHLRDMKGRPPRRPDIIACEWRLIE